MSRTEGPPGAETPVDENASADAAQQWPPGYEAYYAAYYAAAAQQQQQGGATGDYSAYAAYYGQYPGYYGNYSGYGSGSSSTGQGPNHTVWVGNLPEGFPESELRRAFVVFGPIDHIKMYAEKNCAWVQFVNLQDAIMAHASVKYIGPTPVKIGWGKTEAPREDGPAPCRNLWLGNIDPETTEYDIRKEFSVCGQIEKIKVLPQKTCAFVNFATLEAALDAKSRLQGVMIRGKPVRVNFGKAGDGGGDDSEGIHALDSSYLYTGPPQPPAPADNQQKLIIDKLAAHVVKTGPAIEDKVREARGSDPQFAFLRDDGQYNEYYRWKIFDIRQKQKETDANPLAAALAARLQGGPPIVPPAKGQPLPDQERIRLSQILDTLQPTFESIKNGKDFIMSLPQFGSAISFFMCERVNQTPDWTAKLNIIYLANDILHHSAQKRQGPEATNDGFCEAFQPYLASMLYSAYHQQAADRQDKIVKLFDIWRSKEIYSPGAIEVIESAVKSEPVVSSVSTMLHRETQPRDTSGKYRNVSPPPNISQNYHPGPSRFSAQPQGPPHDIDQRLIGNLDDFVKGGKGPEQQGPPYHHGGPPGRGGFPPERDAHGGPGGYRGDDRRRSGPGGDDRRGGYDDRRGGYDDRRGGPGGDDRRRGDDRRGGYDDRRGGDDRRRGYDDRYDDRDDRRVKRGRSGSRSRSPPSSRRRY